MAELRWTEESERWLRDIFDYIAMDDPGAAARIMAGIYEKAQLLTEHPQLGYRYGQKAGREIRILLYGHYRITYLINPSGDIDVLGVFHGALDIDRYLI